VDNDTRTLICPVCGVKFSPYKVNQKYCGQLCRVVNNQAEKKANREAARIRIRECPGCGTAFEPVGRQRFCSMRCGQRIQTRKRLSIAVPVMGTCWWCQAEFRLTDGRRFYCSAEHARFVKSLWNVGKYGITRDDYREAWFRQDGKCAACGRPERTARNHLLCVDHDHVTGRFRGLLCSHCNRAIGLLDDDPVVIEAAARYVRSSYDRAEGCEAEAVPAAG
jgi:predicted nucleic acid-binding Zn ribbon protein